MRERVQVQGPQGSVPLQSTARPGAVSAGAPRVGSSKGEQLARALSQLEPSLQAHLQEAQQEYEVKEAERAYDTLQGMTFDEAHQMVDSGSLRETENPWYEAAFQKQFGVAYAGQRKRDIMLAYESQFDKHNGDIEQFIASNVRADAAKYGENKFVASGIREGMGDFLTRLRDNHAEFRSSVIKETTVDQFRGAASTAIDEAIANGSDPSAAARNLYEQHRQTFGLTYQQMDDNILALAEEYAAKGDAATVEALLSTNITGADGQQVGSFTSRARYSDKANTILNRARTVRGDLDREFMTGEVVGLRQRAGLGGLTDDDLGMLEGMKRDGLISQEMHESLLVQNTNARSGALNSSFADLQNSSYKDHVTNELIAGRGYGVTDLTYVGADGKSHTIKRDQVMDEVVTETLTSMARNGYSEGEMAATLASWGVGSTFQVWQNSMSDGYLSLGQALAAAGPDGDVELPEAALAGYGTWRNLAEYPNVRARHVKDPTALRVYRDAEALERGGMEPETALSVAGRIDRDATRNGISTQLDRNTFNAAVANSASAGFFRGDVANAGWVSSTIERSARILVEAGLPQDRAIEQAARLFDESHTNVNGVAVNTRNKLIPPNFGDMAEIMIDQFASQHGIDADDLTLIPSLDGEQTWVVSYKDTLMPHEEWINGGAYNITEIQDRHGVAMQAERELAREQANAQIDRTIDFRAAKDAFFDLPARHRVNINETSINSPRYRSLQEQFGKEIYPDGGVLFFSPEVRNGVPYSPPQQ
jgi:hypothetical protein